MNHEYRIVFLRRPLAQVVASQAAMIARRKTASLALPAAAMQKALESHLRGVTAWLSAHKALSTHFVDYPELIAHPLDRAAAVAAFLGGTLNAKAMADQVDQSLFRNRA